MPTENEVTAGTDPVDATEVLEVVDQAEDGTEALEVEGEKIDDGEGDKKPTLTAEQKENFALKRRIGRMTNDKALIKAELELAHRQLAEAAKPKEDPPPLTEDDIEQRAQQIAAQRVRQDTVTNQANRFVEDGRKAYKDFDAAVRTVAEEAGGLLDADGNLRPLAAAIFDAEKRKPHEIIKYLADNPELAAELGSMPPIRQIRRIAQIEIEMGQASTPKPSGAPKPVTPVKGSGSISDEPDPKDSERWIKWRNKNADR